MFIKNEQNTRVNGKLLVKRAINNFNMISFQHLDKKYYNSFPSEIPTHEEILVHSSTVLGTRVSVVDLIVVPSRI